MYFSPYFVIEKSSCSEADNTEIVKKFPALCTIRKFIDMFKRTYVERILNKKVPSQHIHILFCKTMGFIDHTLLRIVLAVTPKKWK
jgi:hypothetical protein